MSEFATQLTGTWLELAPWMLLGAFVSGLIHVLIPAAWLQRQLSGKPGVFKAVLLGIPLPLCSCGVIPTGLGLHRNGADKGATVGFLISTPQTGIDSILVAASFLGWPFALLKLGVALVTGLLGGFLASHEKTRSSTEVTDEHCESKPSLGRPNRFKAFRDHALEMIHSVAGWLIAGVILSAAITTWLPAETLAASPWINGPTGLLLALLVSLPLYVCATASVPIAASLVAAGFPPGAALVFLMAGPATNLATLGAVMKELGTKTLTIYLTTLIVGSLGAGWAFGFLVTPPTDHIHQHDHVATWWRIVCGAGLLLIALQPFAGRLLRCRVSPATESIRLNITGMSCNGCATKIQRELEAVSGVTRADVSFADSEASVYGAAEKQALHDAITAAGFNAS